MMNCGTADKRAVGALALGRLILTLVWTFEFWSSPHLLTAKLSTESHDLIGAHKHSWSIVYMWVLIWQVGKRTAAVKCSGFALQTSEPAFQLASLVFLSCALNRKLYWFIFVWSKEHTQRPWDPSHCEPWILYSQMLKSEIENHLLL